MGFITEDSPQEARVFKKKFVFFNNCILKNMRDISIQMLSEFVFHFYIDYKKDPICWCRRNVRYEV